jgi:hypothetical protein
MKTSSTFTSAGWSVTVWFMDAGINNGYPYLSWQNPGGTPVPVESEVYQLPTEFSLSQNYPNPFNPSTTIAYSLPERSIVTLKIYDLLGKEVAALVNSEIVTAGNHEEQWNAANMPSGVYFYRLTSGSSTATKKLVLLK